MNKPILKKQEKGFTIIEVLIVLAIAGLIILIVFLAVPALQRNSRNTQRKNDVSSLIGAVQEVTNNNGGKFPTTTALTDSVKNNAKLGFYDTGNVSITLNKTGYASVTGTDNQVKIVNFAKCGSATATSSTGANARSAVAIYQVETSNGFTDQCQDL